jgi:hypothetical protein
VTSPDEPLAASMAPTTRVASAAPTAAAPPSESFFSSLARKVGLGGSTADATASATQPAAAKPKVEAKRNETTVPKTAAAAKPAETKQATVRQVLKPSVSDAPAAPAAAPAQPAKDGLVAGAQPIVSSNSFDSRFSAAK